MFGGIRWHVAWLLAGALLIAACGDDGDSTASDAPRVSAASEPSDVFAKRLAKLLETTTEKKQCPQLERINLRSFVRFSCPPDKKLSKSMGKFRVIGAEEYGTGAIVDYRSGEVPKGAAIVLFVATDRNWSMSRFGIVTEPSTGTSDEDNRDGYADTVEEYVAAVRAGDCAKLEAVAFTGDLKPKDRCKNLLARLEPFADQLRRHPSAEPEYQGGNESYGFFSVETTKPDTNTTISVVESDSDDQPYTVLDAAPSLTSGQQEGVQRQLREQLRKKRQEQRDQTETGPSPKSKS